MQLPSFDLVGLPNPLPSDHSRRLILPGGLGTAQTISEMRKLVDRGKAETVVAMQGAVTAGKRDFRIRSTLGNILSNCPNKDYYCYAQAIYEFCRDRIKYTFDPVGVELIEDPWRIITESRVADCDSNAVVLATLYESIGLPARFVTVKADPEQPGEWSHIFVEVQVPGRGWIGADPTMPSKYFGWEPDAKFERKVWPASNDGESIEARDDVLEVAKVSGLGRMGEGYIPGIQGSMPERAGGGMFPSTGLSVPLVQLSGLSDDDLPPNQDQDLEGGMTLDNPEILNQPDMPQQMPLSYGPGIVSGASVAAARIAAERTGATLTNPQMEVSAQPVDAALTDYQRQQYMQDRDKAPSQQSKLYAFGTLLALGALLYFGMKGR